MTETESMVVRVARAMAKRYDPTVTVFDAGTFIPLARAAIEAMKTPTVAMIRAAESDLIGTDTPMGAEEAVWRAMIVKALEE